MAKYDSNNQAYTTAFLGCGSPMQLTINGFSSATWRGTVTGTDYVTGEDKTVTVSAGLTGTGSMSSNVGAGPIIMTKDATIAGHVNGIGRAASGPLTISGDLSFSTFTSDVSDSGIVKIIDGIIWVQKQR